MADEHDRDALTPMRDETITPASAGADAAPAAPLKDAAGSAAQALKDNTAKVREQATDKARLFAEDGKARAATALGQLSTLLNDAAAQVDEKLGTQYGQYARTAAERVEGFTSSIESRSVDDIVADARELVRKSPAIAVGAAAAVGFVVARLVSAGIDQRDA